MPESTGHEQLPTVGESYLVFHRLYGMVTAEPSTGSYLAAPC